MVFTIAISSRAEAVSPLSLEPDRNVAIRKPFRLRWLQ